jgi:hypothetical protein
VAKKLRKLHKSAIQTYVLLFFTYPSCENSILDASFLSDFLFECKVATNSMHKHIELILTFKSALVTHKQACTHIYANTANLSCLIGVFKLGACGVYVCVCNCPRWYSRVVELFIFIYVQLALFSECAFCNVY